MKKKLLYTISFFVLLLSAVSCANRAEKKRLYEIFEQSKRAPEYTKVATFVNSLEFKQICCDEFANATLERLCPSWRDSVSIDFRTAYFYPTRDTCTMFYTMDLKIKDLDVEPHAIGSIMLCFGELTRKEGGWRVKIDTVQPFPLEQYSDLLSNQSDTASTIRINIGGTVYMPEGIAFAYRKENQKKKYLDYDEKNIVPEMFCMENAHLLPARMEDFLWQQFWFDKDCPQKANY